MTLTGSLTGQFSDKNVGVNKTVTLQGLALGGSDAGNYTAIAPTSLTASITPAPLSVTGLTAQNKVYDATTVAQLTGTPSFTALGADIVNLTGTPTGQFSDKNVGVGKLVTVTGLSLSGVDAGNYTPIAPTTLQATITPAPLAVGGLTVQTKVYDASTSAPLTGQATVAPLGGDTVTVAGTALAQFGDKNVGNGKSVTLQGLSLQGKEAGNYQMVLPTLTGTILPATLVYVAEPASRTVGQAAGAFAGLVQGWVAGETQATAAVGTVKFTSPAAASPDSVLSVAGSFAITGSGLTAANYTFSQAPGNAQALTVTAVGGPAEPPLIEAQRLQTSTLVLIGAPNQHSNGGVLDLGASIMAPAQVAAPGSGSVNTATMSKESIQGLLTERERVKRQALGVALEQLSLNPELADNRLCTNREDAESGKCLVTEALIAELAQERVNDAQPTVGGKAAGLPPPAKPAPSVSPAAATVRPAWVAPTLGPKRPVVSASLPQIQRKIAVLIGVNDYEDKSIPQLENAVGDAEALARLAEGPLGYETLMLRNPTKAQVVATLNRLAMEANPQDQVLIYYAGHGDEAVAQESGVKNGYWQLADSSAKSPQSWLSNNDIGRLLNLIKARQVALLSDSCYSGRLVDGPRVRATPGPVNPNEVLSDRTVVVMSSGGNAPVADAGEGGHSPFAFHLMQTLGKLQNWKPGANVFETVRFRVANKFPQSPQYGYSGVHAIGRGGDYLFEQRQLSPR
ncbi:YDG domain-containing protein [Inhella gelatinilytica]|uniref:Caspase family protein n=1 Tax=Inhella gelatinilytica TaxID=2795030 RepID=A0A931J0S5_9BURK|nr:YDG domain-containing protein [Inhella gelatinilytica]MBH9554068.1 caspase family protein [Inhella gelatinilytica]